MVEFAGFSMPVQYTSIKEEHRAVREAAGLFDVSHMGQIHLGGRDALQTLERLVTCPVMNMRPGGVRYGLLCNLDGGCVDDVMIYRGEEDRFFLCVNAANIEKDYAWLCSHTEDSLTDVKNRSEQTGLLALQGPQSSFILDATLDSGKPLPPSTLGRFCFGEYEFAGQKTLVSRTGYTGSDGFEIYLDAERVGNLFDALLEAGGPNGLIPAGLGARDTLRLEAALPLYGHELDDSTSPLEAGLGRFVKREKGGFIGAKAIEERERKGRLRQLVGFEMRAPGIARAGYPILCEAKEIGQVTSGSPSPSLGRSIGLGYVPPGCAEPGTSIEIRIRAKTVEAEVVKTPFRTRD